MRTKYTTSLEFGDVFVEGTGTLTVTRVVPLGRTAGIVYVEDSEGEREYGTMAASARFELADAS